MNRYQDLQIEDFERVVRCDNHHLGFTAWVAVHNTYRGPALGGCRLWPYPSDEEALADVLRLSRAMTYKNGLAELPLGGGKSVVRVDPGRVGRETLFEAIGELVEYLDGAYIIAEDVNSTLADMAIAKRKTGHVATVGGSGNPSPLTAYGVYCAIKTCVEYRLGRKNLKGVRVALQGVGETGGRLAKRLYDDGCKIIAADINSDNLEKLSRSILFDRVEPDHIYDVPCDVFSPCALGGVLNQETVPRLLCKIVAGSANNQLADESDGRALHARKILYAPDYAINAGGVINIGCEIGRPYCRSTAYKKTAAISVTLRKILRRSEESGIPPGEVADALAEERFGNRLLV